MRNAGVALTDQSAARRAPPALRVLAYHAIADTGGMGRFEPYGVSPIEFRRQIGALQRLRWHFVSAGEVVAYLGGAPLPRRPVLLTFDDCYGSVLEHALPVLEARGIPAVAFAVTNRTGRTNEWCGPTTPQLPLLDREGLRRLAAGGVEIGGHSRTHPVLPRLSDADLADEIRGCRDDLIGMGLGPARLFAYPFGAFDERVRAAVAAAGFAAAFTTKPRLIRGGTAGYTLGRIEILRRDTGWQFHWKVSVARAWPGMRQLPRAGAARLRRMRSGGRAADERAAGEPEA